MNKLASKTRDITFYSTKNKALITVHSRDAKKYANRLENDEMVKSYKVNEPLDKKHMTYISKIDIRGGYFDVDWTSDFVIEDINNLKSVRELISIRKLKERAVMEKLELSRRYWEFIGCKNWKIVMIKGDK